MFIPKVLVALGGPATRHWQAGQIRPLRCRRHLLYSPLVQVTRWGLQLKWTARQVPSSVRTAAARAVVVQDNAVDPGAHHYVYYSTFD